LRQTVHLRRRWRPGALVVARLRAKTAETCIKESK
jgi:hypothetical protein